MTKCLIIGSGIVGLTTAYELNKTGHQVTIIDNQSTGQASKSAAGIMFPLNPWKNTKYMQDLCISGHEQYNNFFNTLSIKDKREINFEKKNLLIFGNDIESAKNWYMEKPVINSSYIKKNLNSREKFIKEFHKNFLEIENINTLDPRKLINFLRNALLKNNVEFKKSKIEKLDSFLRKPSNNKYEFIILCAGVWSNHILGNKNIRLKPIKGQLLHFKTREKLIDNVLLYNNYYIIPRRDNRIVVGATIEDVGFDENITSSAKIFLEKSVSEIFSGSVEMLSLEQTYGFRPYSDKEDPYINIDIKNERLIYNFGHYRYGILTAISSAKIVKKLIS